MVNSDFLPISFFPNHLHLKELADIGFGDITLHEVERYGLLYGGAFAYKPEYIIEARDEETIKEIDKAISICESHRPLGVTVGGFYKSLIKDSIIMVVDTSSIIIDGKPVNIVLYHEYVDGSLIMSGYTPRLFSITREEFSKLLYEQTDRNFVDDHKIEFIAKARHLAWTCFQSAAGQPYNLEMNKDQLDSLKNGVIFLLNNPDSTVEQNHDNWVKCKLEQGWVYGEEKDLEKKTHPDLVPYNDLPEIEKTKDNMDVVMNREFNKLWNEYFSRL